MCLTNKNGGGAVGKHPSFPAPWQRPQDSKYLKQDDA